MNTLRSSQRFSVLIDKLPESPVKKRDEIFGLLTTVSFVHEGIKTSAGILNQLASSLPKLRNEIAWVLNEYNKSDSFFNTTLSDIRNQAVFHFGLQLGDNILKCAVKKYPPIFAEGTSEQIIDWSYTLADKVVEAVLMKFEPSSGTDEEKAYNLVKQFTDYTLKLSDVLENVIAELIYNHAIGSKQT